MLNDIKKEQAIDIDVIVLAIPHSNRDIAQVFIDHGIKHVVCFDFYGFPFKQMKLIDNKEFEVKDVMKIIYSFTVKFYAELVNEKSIKDAFLSSKDLMN